MDESSHDTMRIGELAARTGVTTHVLRAWESRYGLIAPMRTTGGYRAYTREDERRVRAVVALRDEGVSAAEACRRVLEATRIHGPVVPEEPAPARTDAPGLVARMLEAVRTLDEQEMHAALDAAFTHQSPERVIVEVITPLFALIGTGWSAGEIGIAEEHFASSLVRRRLSALSLTWGTGNGPLAVLACPPDEFHDLILLGFGVLLGRAGWQVRYLGQNTTIASLTHASERTRPDAIVLAGRRPEGFRAHLAELRELNRRYPLWLAGRGATPRLVEELGAHTLGADLAAAVVTLTTHAQAKGRDRTAATTG